MNNSLKAGIISGLIAGIISAIVYQFFMNMAFSLGLLEPWWRENVFYTSHLVAYIPVSGFYGIIFGAIYSRVYDIIPRKGVRKWLIYGFLIWFITVFRIHTYVLPYGYGYLNAAADYIAGFFGWMSFGLVLGLLFEFLSSRYYPTKEKKKIITYDMKSGLLPGAIAGFCGGIAAGIVATIGHATGYWVSQAGTHILINMIWGTVFGTFFAKVYNLVPGKKALKGLYFGLIMVFITSIETNLIGTSRLIHIGLWEVALPNFLANLISIANAIVFGLVLGLLYRKPTK
jgi:MFS family permease